MFLEESKDERERYHTMVAKKQTKPPPPLAFLSVMSQQNETNDLKHPSSREVKDEEVPVAVVVVVAFYS